MKIDNREVKHDVYGKRQDEIAFLPKKGDLISLSSFLVCELVTSNNFSKG